MVHEEIRAVVELADNDDESVPSLPNRKEFQNLLEHCNSSIQVGRTRLNNACQNIKIVEDCIRAIELELQMVSEPYKKNISDYKKKLIELKKSQFELLQECVVRSLDKVEQQLMLKEKEYNDTQLNRCSEHTLVNEINLLKRNRTRLIRLRDLQKDKIAMEELINEQNQQLKKCTEPLKNKRNSYRQKKCELIKEIKTLQSNIKGFGVDRKSLIGGYNFQKEAYTEWAKKNKKDVLSTNSSYPASFPVRLRRTSAKYIDDQELEPFFEQKRDCRRLIHYLERIEKTQLSKAESTTKADSGDDNDSADDFPAAFENLSVSSPSRAVPKISKKTVNQSKIKKIEKRNQPISHDVEIYNLFGTVGIDVPRVNGDVPQALVQVRDKLALIDQQTNEINWDEELKFFASYTKSRTQSDYTADSMFDSVSESASMYSSSRCTSALESPLNLTE